MLCNRQVRTDTQLGTPYPVDGLLCAVEVHEGKWSQGQVDLARGIADRIAVHLQFSIQIKLLAKTTECHGCCAQVVQLVD